MAETTTSSGASSDNFAGAAGAGEEDPTTSDPISCRLRDVQRTLRKLSRDQASPFSTNNTATTIAGRLRIARRQQQEENDEPNGGGEGDDEDEEQRHRASFHLGMELFQDPGAAERAVIESLSKVEREVNRIVISSANSSSRAAGDAAAAGGMADDGVSSNIVASPDQLQADAEHLKSKIAFLRECSKVRSLLDESIQISSPSGGAASASATGAFSSEGAAAAGGMPASGGGGIAGTNQHHLPDLAQSAKRLVEALRGLERIQHELDGRERGGEVDAEDEAHRGKVVDSIRAAARRQKVHLLRRAKVLWQTCVQVAPGSISVRGGGGAAKGGEFSDADGKPPLLLAYETMEILSPPASRGSSAGSDDDDGGGGPSSALEDIMRSFLNALHSDIFLPALERHGEGKAAAAATTSYAFRESEERGGSGTSSTTVVTSAATSQKLLGPVRRLEWNVVESDKKGDEERPSTAVAFSENVAAWKGTFDLLNKILSFVVDRVLLGRRYQQCQVTSSLRSFVGKRLFGRPDAQPRVLNLDVLGLESRRLGDDHGLLLEPLLQRLKSTCVPSSSSPRIEPSDLQQQIVSLSDQLRTIIDPFMEFLSSSGLISSSQQHRFGTFASSLQQLNVDSSRCVVLNRARRSLMETDYHNTVLVGKELVPEDEGREVFILHRCAVSKTAFSVLELCRETMDEAVEHSKHHAQQQVDDESPLALLPAVLYRSARETLDLFRAIIPVSYGYEIQNVPRTAAVFHNDCVYLAHHCLTLGLVYRDKFASAVPETEEGDVDGRGKLVRQTCMFVDMVPLFRDLADRSMGDMLELQANQIAEIVGQRIPLLGAALASDEILAEWSEAETALTAGLYHLRHLFQAWKPVLSKDILTRSMWYLCDVVFTLFLDQVLNARDISIDASKFVSTLFEKATYEIKELLCVGDDTSGSRVYDRFFAVGRFMDMTLSDVQVALGRGMFRCVSGPELIRLIVATFDDSPKRQGVINILTKNT